MFKVQAKEKPKDPTVVLSKEAYYVLVDTAKQNHASIKETASQMILYANDAPPLFRMNAWRMNLSMRS